MAGHTTCEIFFQSHNAELGPFKQLHKHITMSHISHNSQSQIPMHFFFFKCLKTRVGQCLIVQWSYNK